MLTIEDIHVRYGKNPVLQGVSASGFQPGSITGLLGPNAAGKSTLVKTIAGIQRASSGTCRITSNG